MIKNLQSLRGLAAIMIFYHHYGFQSYIIDSFGDFGVIFFMMLSGFVLYVSTEHNVNNGGTKPKFKEFLYQRLSKIYPLYIICWIAAIVFMPYSGSRFGVLLGVFTLQSWIPSKEVYFAGNSVAWFISDLMFCYLIFVPLFRQLHKKSICGTTILATYFVLYLCVVIFLPERLVHAIVYVNPLMQCANFIGGMILGKYYLSKQKCNFKIRTNLSELIVLAVVVISMFLYKYVATRLSFGLYWWPAAGMSIYIFSCSDKLPSIINKFLQSEPLMHIGQHSFSFYLIHYIGISLWHRGMECIGLATSDNVLQVIQSIILIIILLVASFLINRYIEVPIIKTLRHRG